MTEELHIVYGFIDEHGDIDTWVEEIFANREQASACRDYLNLTKSQENVHYFINIHYGLCNEDYVSKLDELTKEEVKL